MHFGAWKSQWDLHSRRKKRMLLRNRRSIQNVLVLLILTMCLTVTSGCSNIKELDIFKKEVKRTPLNLDEPDPIQLGKVEWLVINKDNYEKVFKKLQEGKKDIVLFGLTDDGYEQLAINFAQVRKYIMLNRNVLMQYKKYYEGNDDGSEETRTRK